MRIGVCTSVTNVEQVPPGLDFLEGTVGELLCPRRDESAFEEALSRVRGAPLPVEAANALIPGDLKTTGPDSDPEAVEAYVAGVCERARRMGLKRVVFGSGGSRRVPGGFDRERAADQIVEHMRRWAPLAERAGVILVLEPLNRGETNIVNSVDEGAELVRRVDHPCVRLLADTYHMAKEGESPDAVRRAGELIAHVHCAEAGGRVPLGFGGEDHRPYFRALKDIGYDDRIAVEARWENFPRDLPRAVAELRRQIDTA